jgi:hypothetical protein
LGGFFDEPVRFFESEKAIDRRMGAWVVEERFNTPTSST